MKTKKLLMLTAICAVAFLSTPTVRADGDFIITNPVHVPEAGSTLGMLAVSAIGIGLLRRGLRRT